MERYLLWGCQCSAAQCVKKLKKLSVCITSVKKQGV